METLAESEGEPTFGNFLSHQILFSLWIIAQKFKRSLCANKNPSLSEHDWLGMLALFLILLLKLGIILLFSLSCFHRRWSGSLRRGRSHPPTAPWTDGLLWGGGVGLGSHPSLATVQGSRAWPYLTSPLWIPVSINSLFWHLPLKEEAGCGWEQWQRATYEDWVSSYRRPVHNFKINRKSLQCLWALKCHPRYLNAVIQPPSYQGQKFCAAIQQGNWVMELLNDLLKDSQQVRTWARN